MQTGQRFVLVELVHQSLTGSFEMSRVLRRPPVREFAFGVKLRTGIVEAMADLVSDGSADRAVVGRSVRLRIEERRFQNGSGEVESILEREIKRVDRLRSHPPFVA